MKIRLLTATALTAAAAVLLVGCTATDNHASPTAAPTSKAAEPTQKVTPPADIKSSDVVCEDGTATVTTNNEKVTVPDCATVVVKASNSIVQLGDVTKLTVEGSINSVTTQADVNQLTVTGDANSVTTGGSPKVTDSGKQNDITAK